MIRRSFTVEPFVSPASNNKSILKSTNKSEARFVSPVKRISFNETDLKSLDLTKSVKKG